MDLITSVKTCFHKYVDFNGRASRSEFWWFYLFTALVLLACYLVQAMLSLLQFAAAGTRVSLVFGLISVVVNLAILAVAVALTIPLLAVGSRRLHDRDQSGWLQLLLLVPCASIALIVLWALDGSPGPNHFGYPPQWAPPAISH
jgi:uncharacterized membrane protein YhaH (DUF805 family)